MMTIPERLTLGFYNWELRGRGWYYFPEPVQLEPPFYPFSHYNHLPQRNNLPDDGKIPSLAEKLWNVFKQKESQEVDEAQELEYDLTPFPAEILHNPVEFQLTVPEGENISLTNQHELLLMLASSRYPVSFEVIGTGNRIVVQIVCDESEAPQVHEYIKLFLPKVIISKQTRYIDEVWSIGACSQIVYLALQDEFMRPIVSEMKPAIDPFTGLYATLEQIKEDEMAMVQVLFQGTRNAWHKSILRSVTDFQDRPFFLDDETMLPLAKEKISAPLYGVSIRLVANSNSDQRNQELLDGMYRGMTNTNPGSYNSFSPMVINLPYEDQATDIIMRTSHVLGMLLNSKELVQVVHLPFASVQASKLHQNMKRTKLLPVSHIHENYALGINEHFGIAQTIGLSMEERLRHMHIIGATGSGKSNLLIHLIAQDIEHGNGICVLDPHGDLIDACIGYIPEERLKDVIVIDPSQTDYSVGLNLLTASSYHEQMVLESDLVSVFKRQSTSWGDQMTSVLSNAINAFLESKRSGTLLDLRRFLVDSGFRNEFLKSVQDETVHTYWKHEFPVLKNNSIAPILTRLDTFLRPKVLRNMMMQRKGIDFNEVMSGKKIVLVKLSQGLIGEQNSYLLGTLIIAKLNQYAQARQQMESSQRTPFYIYIDEFQNFITDSLSSILSGARKYGVGLVLAHQSLEQVTAKDKEVAESILSNPYTRVCFRLGDSDAKKLDGSFASFDTYDLQNLKVGDALVRIGQRDHDGNITVPIVPKMDRSAFERNIQLLTEQGISSYGKPIEEVKILHDDIVEPILQEQEVEEEKIDIIRPEIKPAILPQSETINIQDSKNEFIAQEEKRYELKQHQFLQSFIKKSAEGLGFKATLEVPTSNGGRLDIELIYEQIKIAIEISVTNTVAYELQNIEKCFASGYATVYMVSEDVKHLRNIREQAIKVISASYHSQLHFLSKDECIEQLIRFTQGQQRSSETKIKGYKVKVKSHNAISVVDQKNLLNNVIRSVKRR